jgi:hypothetical protein
MITNRITITVDLTKLDKSRIKTRNYERNGEQFTAKEIQLDIVPLREREIKKEGETWRLLKTCFVAEAPTKEERQSKAKTSIVGDGVEFQDIQAPATEAGDQLDSTLPF